MGLAHTEGAATETINTNTKISNVDQKEEKSRLQTRGLDKDPKRALYRVVVCMKGLKKS